MARPELSILISARDEASKVLGNISNQTEDMSRKFRKAGMIMTAAGGAIVGVLGMAVKAAAEEQAGIIRLSTAMRNVGLNYEANKDQIEGVIDAMQQKTSFADEKQRESLASLVLITKDVNKALDLNALVMDIAAGTGKDLTSSTQLLAYALSGNWGMVNRLIPALKQASTEEERWTLLRKMFVGQAEAYGKSVAGQFELLKNNIGDIQQSIGAALIPVVSASVKPFQQMAQAIKSIPPQLIQVGVGGAAATGALLLLGGPMLILISYFPRIKAGFQMMQAQMARTRATAIGLRASLIGVGGALGIAAGVIVGALLAGYKLADMMKKSRETMDLTTEAVALHSEATRENLDWVDKQIATYLDLVEEKGRAIRFSKEEYEAMKQIYDLRPKLIAQLEEEAKAQKELVDTQYWEAWDKLAASLKFARTEAGQYGITMDDVVNYLVDVKASTFDATIATNFFREELKDLPTTWEGVIEAMELYGLEAENVARHAGKLTDELTEEERALMSLQEQWADVIEQFYYAQTAVGQLGVEFKDVFAVAVKSGAMTGMEFLAVLQELGAEAGDLNKVVIEVFGSVEAFADAMDRVTESAVAQTAALTAAQQAVAGLIPHFGPGGVLTGFYDPAILGAIQAGLPANLAPQVGMPGQFGLAPGQVVHLPEMQYGGVVPGPYGEPKLIMAHGGETVSPRGGGITNIINLSPGVLMGNEADARALARKVLNIIREEQRRTYGLAS